MKGSVVAGKQTPEPGARRRGAVLLAAVLALGLAGTGCGVRTTSVPVDAGAAPSRMSCTPPPGATGEPESQSADSGERRATVPARVYLVCASGLSAVHRTVRIPVGGSGSSAVKARVATAQALLGALEQRPSEEERQAGFATYVQGPLSVSPGRDGDPEGTLRLSRQPEDLPPAALSQIVCTYADFQTVADGGTVSLGGPGDYPVRRYVCAEAVKVRPESAVPTMSL
ncbi:hypothetical protein [Streptomyces sp. MUM 203J]|uniref:hypothetical protein n=1 Tax=Streptomyces sp. MUM 203J TaxID=2791990 RepID=UPI001F03F38D|nr:hypothetical protein [Streptomyces sp. MUM 203J]